MNSEDRNKCMFRDLSAVSLCDKAPGVSVVSADQTLQLRPGVAPACSGGVSKSEFHVTHYVGMCTFQCFSQFSGTQIM